jgi:hypothetical protein
MEEKKEEQKKNLTWKEVEERLTRIESILIELYSNQESLQNDTRYDSFR